MSDALHELPLAVELRPPPDVEAALVRLAGLPQSVIERAKLVLAKLEQEDRAAPKGFEDLPLFAVPQKAPQEKPESVENSAIAALSAINPDDLSPREAMEALYRLKEIAAKTRN